jgi:hypothetical protein
MDTGYESNGSTDVIEVYCPDEEQDLGVYQGWVRDCPEVPPIIRAELLARAIVASGNYPARHAITLPMRYWANQRPRIRERILTGLIATGTPTRGTTRNAHVRNDLRPNVAIAANEVANMGTLHAHHALSFGQPFDQVHNNIVPVFNLDDRMIAWREALPPSVADVAEPPESDDSEEEVALSQ